MIIVEADKYIYIVAFQDTEAAVRDCKKFIEKHKLTAQDVAIVKWETTVSVKTKRKITLYANE